MVGSRKPRVAREGTKAGLIGFVGALLAAFGLSSNAAAQGTLYLVEDNSQQLYTVDTTTAVPSLVGPAGNCEGLSLSEDSDTLFCIGNNQPLVRVETDGSGGSIVGGGSTPAFPDRGLTFDTSNGVLYGSDNGFGVIDPATGGLVQTLSSPTGSDIECLAYDRSRDRIYGLDDQAVDKGRLFSYDIESDTWTQVAVTGISFGDCGLAYDPNADLLYAVSAAGVLYRIVPTTAAVTTIGDTGLTPSPGPNDDTDYGLTFVPAATTGRVGCGANLP